MAMERGRQAEVGCLGNRLVHDKTPRGGREDWQEKG